jgi:hypothetical protein
VLNRHFAAFAGETEATLLQVAIAVASRTWKRPPSSARLSH